MENILKSIYYDIYFVAAPIDKANYKFQKTATFNYMHKVFLYKKYFLLKKIRKTNFFKYFEQKNWQLFFCNFCKLLKELYETKILTHLHAHICLRA